MTGHFALGLGLALLAILLLRQAAPALGLIDNPGGPNGRKTHAAPTPVIGGLAIVAALAAGLALTGAGAGLPPELLAAMLAIAVIGAADDRFDLPKSLRFGVQLAVGCLVALAAGITHLPLVTAATGLEVPAALAVVLTGVAVAALINAVNWLDGLDGLLGVLVLISLGVALHLLAGTASPALITLVTLAAGAVVAFLAFNLRRPGLKQAAVFIGDAGSGLLAVILGYVMLVGARIEGLDPLLMLGVGNGVFFADMAFVIVLRLMTHGRPWRCDRSHLHYRLTDRGMSVTETVLIAASAHALFLTIQTGAIAGDPDFVLPWTLALIAATGGVLLARRVGGTQARESRAGR